MPLQTIPLPDDDTTTTTRTGGGGGGGGTGGSGGTSNPGTTGGATPGIIGFTHSNQREDDAKKVEDNPVIVKMIKGDTDSRRRRSSASRKAPTNSGSGLKL